jgi:CDP-2,3-bis-(O-geranylgeranyl)-sn-glycerol synthase
MLTLILSVIWFFLPAGVANMAPVLVKNVDFLNYPLDFNKTFRGKRIFGKNKTFRGLYFGILSAILVLYLQSLWYTKIPLTYVLNYSTLNIILVGSLFGLGALFGDAIESFVKRQQEIKPGKPLLIFDQIDWILGGLLAVWYFADLTIWFTLTTILVYSLLHPAINYIGYLLGLKKNKF